MFKHILKNWFRDLWEKVNNNDWHKFHSDKRWLRRPSKIVDGRTISSAIGWKISLTDCWRFRPKSDWEGGHQEPQSWEVSTHRSLEVERNPLRPIFSQVIDNEATVKSRISKGVDKEIDLNITNNRQQTKTGARLLLMMKIDINLLWFYHKAEPLLFYF